MGVSFLTVYLNILNCFTVAIPVASLKRWWWKEQREERSKDLLTWGMSITKGSRVEYEGKRQ